MTGRSMIVGVGLLRVCCIERGKCMGARCQLRNGFLRGCVMLQRNHSCEVGAVGC